MISKKVSDFVDSLLKNPTNDGFLPGTTFIPASSKKVDNAEIKMMVEASIECWLTTGKFNAQFEKNLLTLLALNI